MINIFEDLKKIGFEDFEKVDLYPAKADVSKSDGETKKARLTPAEVLYDKTYTCPVCGKVFKSKAIRSGKNRLINVDIDLKANYDIVNPLIYECVVCENCGYSALAKSFNTLSSSQIRWIKEQICTRYKPQKYPEYLTEKQAVLRYKLTLLNAFVKKAKDGEKAYICLKLAWLYRDMKEKALEDLFLQNALTGFENAYNNERFPIFELGELTTAYIIATIYRNMGEYDKAMQWVGFVVMDRSVSLRLRTKGLHLKGIIAEEKKKKSEANVN